jgi:hypothetical protein
MDKTKIEIVEEKRLGIWIHIKDNIVKVHIPKGKYQIEDLQGISPLCIHLYPRRK